MDPEPIWFLALMLMWMLQLKLDIDRPGKWVSTGFIHAKAPIIPNSQCPIKGEIDLPTFDADPKSAKIPNSQCPGGGGVDFPTFDNDNKSA